MLCHAELQVFPTAEQVMSMPALRRRAWSIDDRITKRRFFQRHGVPDYLRD